MPESGKRNLSWMCFGWLLCGALHLLLYSVDFFNGFAQFCCGVYTILWGISIHKRVTDRRLRLLLMGIAGCLMLYLTLQVLRYNLIRFFPVADRYLWYAFYVPMTAMPVLCCFVALYVNRPQEEKHSPWHGLLAAAGALLALGVLTNDLHFFFKSFPEGISSDASARSGWLYYGISIYTYGIYIFSFLLLLHKSRAYRGQCFRWLPMVPLAVGILYFLLFPLDIGHQLFGKRVWNIGEMLVFCITAALEACIQAGMIPANTDYDKLFPLADLSAVIVDGQGQLRYASGVDAYPFQEEKGIQIMRQPISGGQIAWQVNLSPLLELNDALAETAQMLEARNAYLAEEARIQAEKTELETRNAIYDRITRLVRPQLDKINALLDQMDIPLEKKMRPITLMSTYIKRRSNMEFLEKDGFLPLDELHMAILESTESLRLCGIQAVCVSQARGDFPASIVMAAYEQIESVIEDCFDTLTGLVISLDMEKGRLSVRMLLTAEALTLPTPQPIYTGKDFVPSMTVTKDGQDVILLFTYQAGGEMG